MDEDYYDEMNDESVNESDEEIRPPYNGTKQPYMFEPTMAPEEAAAHEIVAKTALSEMNGRRLADVSKWYVCWFIDVEIWARLYKLSQRSAEFQ